MEMSPRTYTPLQGLFLSIGSHGLVFRGREGSHIVSPQKSRFRPDVEEYKLYNFSQEAGMMLQHKLLNILLFSKYCNTRQLATLSR